MRFRYARLIVLTVIFGNVIPSAYCQDLTLTLRDQSERADGRGPFQMRERGEKWKPNETAIIVCDVWDLHHCQNAVRRLEEFAPRLDHVLKEARSRGVTIIHAPSDCMDAYADHPARLLWRAGWADGLCDGSGVHAPGGVSRGPART